MIKRSYVRVRPVVATGDTCDVVAIDKAGVARARKRQTDDATVAQAVILFKMLGDATRLRIVEALGGGALCVCDLAELLGITQSAVSHQLRLLRQAGLVTFRREGKSSRYRLDDAHVERLTSLGFEHVGHADRRRL